MDTNTRIHDGIIGATVFVCAALAYYVGTWALWILAAVGLTMIQSAFTGFCPVHYTVGRLRPKAPESGGRAAP